MGQREHLISGQGYSSGWGYTDAQGQNNYGQSEREKPTTGRTIDSLSNLRREFQSKAADYTRMAAAVGDAIELLKDAENAKTELAELKKLESRRNYADDLATLIGKFGKKDELWFFGDGSGSMPALRGKNGSAMDEALNGMAAATKAAQKSGYKGVKSFLWGDEQPIALDFDKTPSSIEIFRNGTGCGTNLAPVAKMLSAAETNKKPHYVILSDGDVFDRKEAVTALGQALGKNPNATIDFIVMRPNGRIGGTEMEALANDIAKIFPSQVRLATVDLSVDDSFSNTLKKALTARLPQPEAAPKTKTAGPTPPTAK